MMFLVYRKDFQGKWDVLPTFFKDLERAKQILDDDEPPKDWIIIDSRDKYKIVNQKWGC